MCRRTLRAALLMALLVSCTLCGARADGPPPANPDHGALVAALKSVVLKIDGMKCEECVRTIERALRRARGVKSATVTRADSKARVTYDPDQTSVPRLIETIEKLKGMGPYTAREAD
jgi:copper chaperone CopZ